MACVQILTLVQEVKDVCRHLSAIWLRKYMNLQLGRSWCCFCLTFHLWNEVTNNVPFILLLARWTEQNLRWTLGCFQWDSKSKTDTATHKVLLSSDRAFVPGLPVTKKPPKPLSSACSINAHSSESSLLPTLCYWYSSKRLGKVERFKISMFLKLQGATASFSRSTQLSWRFTYWLQFFKICKAKVWFDFSK